jgi:diguanylate cyclase (GGDEF)-like protein/PAS domain S-box-containing protein
LIVAGVDAVRSFDDSRAAAEAGLAAERRRIEALTRHSPVGIFETDAEGHMLYLNERLGEMTGLPAGAAGDATIAASVHPDDLEVVSEAWWQAVATGFDFDLDYRYVRPDGSVCWAIGHASAIGDGEGGVSGFLGTVQDVTELRQREAALREAEERFRHAFDHALIGVALVSPDGEWLRVNRRMCAMTGYDEDQLLEMTFQELTHPDDLQSDLTQLEQLLAGEIAGYEMQKRYFRADGETIWVLLSVSLVRGEDDEPLYFVSQIQDITERHREERELRRMADTDPLTGLANRRRFADDLAREVARTEREGSDLALLLLDIDGFKGINDTLGHRAGDELLRRIADTLTAQMHGTGIVGRLGGDEFAVLLPDVDRATARKIAEVVLGSIRAEPLKLDGVELRPTVSIGVAMAGDVSGAEKTLLAGADLAMYEAKAAGRDRVAELEPDAAARLAS